jgi:hypothetical protein
MIRLTTFCAARNAREKHDTRIVAADVCSMSVRLSARVIRWYRNYNTCRNKPDSTGCTPRNVSHKNVPLAERVVFDWHEPKNCHDSRHVQETVLGEQHLLFNLNRYLIKSLNQVRPNHDEAAPLLHGNEVGRMRQSPADLPNKLLTYYIRCI